MKKVLFGVSVGILLSGPILASTISGKVQCHMEKMNIPDALVILMKPGDKDFSKTVVSGATGNFFFPDVEDGKYNIEVVKDGFYKNVLFDLKVESDKSYTVTVKLLRKTKKGDSDYCFMLGGIEVCSEQKDIIPEEMVTTRKVSSGEIEHMQATNLGDILSLVPGIEKNNNPGLSKTTQVGVRGVAMAGSPVLAEESFGSMIIVDGNEISADSRVGSSGRTGIDLRSIPADNIESVEVIAGIPSVKYSNFSQGLIKVNTKTGRVAPKLKAKFNPDTKTISFSHGLKSGERVFDYHLNYARSERDLRKKDDEFHRIYGSGNYSFNSFGGRLQNRLQGTFTQMIQNEPPTDVYKTKDRDRSYRITSAYSFDYENSQKTKYSGMVNLNIDRNKSFRALYKNDQYPVQVDTTLPLIVGTDTTWYDTTITKQKIGYIGEKSEIGVEWKTGIKFLREKDRHFAGQDHHFLAGIELDREFNTGEGLVLDEDWNYYGYYSSRRSYRYDDYPSLTSLSLYAEDEMKGQLLGRKYDLMAGLRFDSFNPTGITTADQGVFLCPRVNFRYFFTEDFRIRVGAGRSAKAVSLGYIFREPKYIKYAVGDSLVEEV
ncbi:MAG: TonB-dependent receptor, partial [Candidatus Marinimicrobia bacterium]|nr:TonB-dependent receptor [Candidatus Neomarinimicrobiota bacterium]